MLSLVSWYFKSLHLSTIQFTTLWGKKAKFYHISKFETKLMSWEKPKILTIDNNNNNKQKEKQIGERLEFSSIKF